MEPNEPRPIERATPATDRADRRSAVGNAVFRFILVICLLVATASLAFIALQERVQTKCAQASANADAWIAVNVVARDFNKEVSLAENEAAVTAVDRRLRDCLPGGR